MTSDALALARRLIDDVVNRGDLEAVDEVMAPDYVHHDPSLPSKALRGRETYKELLWGILSAFAGVHMTVDDVVAQGDRVAARWTFHGIHRGEILGVPGTGGAVTFHGSSTFRVADGRIVEGWTEFDTKAMRERLGALPIPA